MTKYYILFIDSLIHTFSVIDSGTTVNFELATQAESPLFEQISTSDFVLGCVMEPINKVKYLFEVQGVDTPNRLKLKKILDIDEGVEVEQYISRNNMSIDVLQKIDEEQFINICKKMQANIISALSLSGDIEQERETEIKNIKNTGTNTLLYGIPGSGKSFRANKMAHTAEHPERVTNVVFHQEYSYQDFIGQVMPKIESVKTDGSATDGSSAERKSLNYSFVPGPFTDALRKAYQDPSNDYYLIIDEINRGNAPAIFGETFQLLDRDQKTRTSSYGVNNVEMAKIIYENADATVNKRTNGKIFIPGNLTIIATMNTGDQNVFRLDTAFTRRWSKELVRNDFKSDETDTASEKEYLQNLSNTVLFSKEPDHSKLNPNNITWKNFAQSINTKINELNQNGDFSEDKGLGAFFVSPCECESQTAFGEKVIMYLWYDVFRYSDKNIIFKEPTASFEFMLDKFREEGLNIFADGVITAQKSSRDNDGE